jgi:hypothetical protein
MCSAHTPTSNDSKGKSTSKGKSISNDKATSKDKLFTTTSHG